MTSRSRRHGAVAFHRNRRMSLHRRLAHEVIREQIKLGLHILRNFLPPFPLIVHGLAQDGEIKGPGLALEAKAAHHEVLVVHMALAIDVEEVEKTLRLRYVQVYLLEVGLHEGASDLTFELLIGDPAGAVTVALHDEFLDLIDELAIVSVPDIAEGEVEEDAVYEVQHDECCEANVESEERTHQRVDVARERVDEILPVHATHQSLEE
mmetsp:Transcript_17828/g.36753  ORF Transcript_17828/g.36753 Transcript_17828/m.36753 type:complete len:208 (+) Transcript_17828:51-674(+)